MTALPNWVQFARRPSMLVTWYREGTTVVEDLTGSTITGLIAPHTAPSPAVAITGTLTITSAVGDVFRWDFSAADVAVAGNFDVQFTATYSSGQTPAKTFRATWYIEKALVVA